MCDAESFSSGMVVKDRILSVDFNDAIRDKIDGCVADKTLRWITEEEKEAEGYVEYRPVILLKPKRIKKNKCRLSFSGNDDPPEMFNPDDHFYNFFTVFAMYFDMEMRTTDVVTSFRSHNS